MIQEMKREATAPAAASRVYRSPIDQVRFLITGEQSNGTLFMAEVTVPPGCGNPPHIHTREEETFYVQQGELTVQVGDKTVTASAGQAICLPRDVPHSFVNSGKIEAKAVVVAVPAGLEKFFEEAFYPVDEYPAEPPTMDAFIGRVVAAAPKVGLQFLPPPK